VGFLKQGSPCFDYFFAAGVVVVVVVVVPAAGAAFAEDIGACAGAAGAAGAACSAAGAGAGASSFFLQPADRASAKPRQSAKEISFFIDGITSLLFRFTVIAHCALLYLVSNQAQQPPYPGRGDCPHFVSAAPEQIARLFTSQRSSSKHCRIAALQAFFQRS
jgi:hypothetical protein